MDDTQLMYAPTFEGLFLLSGKGRFTPEARAELKTVGLDLDKPLLPGYPTSVFTATTRIAAKHLFPGVEREEAVRRTGELAVQGYTSTLLGRALFGILRVIGTRRSMLRMARNLGGGTNFLTASTVEVGPTEFLTEISDVTDLPTYYQGVIKRAALIVGTDVQVLIEAHPRPGCTYRVRW